RASHAARAIAAGPISRPRRGQSGAPVSDAAAHPRSSLPGRPQPVDIADTAIPFMSAPGEDIFHLWGTCKKNDPGAGWQARVAKIAAQTARDAIIFKTDAPAFGPVLQMAMGGKLGALELLADLIARSRGARIGQIGVKDIGMRPDLVTKDRRVADRMQEPIARRVDLAQRLGAE